MKLQNNVVELEPISFIAGDYQEMTYRLKNVDGSLINLEDATDYGMVLYMYGDQDNPVATFAGTIGEDLSSFSITIPSSTTEDLPGGLYIQQIFIKYGTNKIFKPAEGKVAIKARGIINTN